MRRRDNGFELFFGSSFVSGFVSGGVLIGLSMSRTASAARHGGVSSRLRESRTALLFVEKASFAIHNVGTNIRLRPPRQHRKSFLLLFFKKEDLAFLPASRPQRSPIPSTNISY
jgi:hypothetical protein